MTQARHIFHPSTSGWDQVHAWKEATGEPVFVWGSRSGQADGQFFGSVKKEFSMFLEGTADCSLSVYHDGIGADVLGPLDTATQKLLHIHHWFPRWEKNFDWTIRCTGKVLVSHKSQVQLLKKRFGWIPERFMHAIPQPELKTSLESHESPLQAKPRTGIWLHGRKWQRYGNRLRAAIDRWPAEAGELEIVATGARQPAWARKDHVIWSADLPFDFALYRIFTWDSTLLLNDYSLDSPWLLQALSLDCFPLVPEGEGISRTSLWHTDSAPKPYPWGELDKAIELVRGWRKQREALLDQFRNWRSGLMAERQSGDAFNSEWDKIKKALIDQRAPNLRARKPAPSWYPVSWYERVQRLRAGL